MKRPALTLIPGLFMMLLLGAGQTLRAEAAPSLTALVYKKLTEAQQALQQEQPDSAVRILQQLQNNPDNTPYDNAMVWHTLGYVYSRQNQLSQAVKAFEQVFEFDIPAGLRRSNHRILGQTYLSLDRYREALPHLQAWLNSAGDDQQQARVLLARCYYALERYQAAADQLQTVIEQHRRQGQAPKESWLNLLQAARAHMDDIRGRIDTIKLLLAWFPKPEYWLALASAYAQLNQMDNYLAILALAERKELLTTATQYLSLASVYLDQGAPQKAAQMVEEGMARGLVVPKERNLRFLAGAYTLAREYQQALAPLRQAAALTSSGEVDVLLGNALFQLARWEEASTALARALEKGQGDGKPLARAFNVWLMLGQSLLNLKQYEAAIAAFQQAASDEERGEQAQQWLQYVRYEQERQRELQQGGAS